jgi:hypothetical protein
VSEWRLHAHWGQSLTISAPPLAWGCILKRRGYKMAALFTSLAAALITDKPAPGGPQLYELMVDASLGHAPAPRAHSPLR